MSHLVFRKFVFISLIAVLSGCQSLFDSGTTKSSRDTSSKSRIAYKPISGQMDFVEYFINKELASSGLDSEKLEKKGSDVFDSSKSWKPRGKNTIPVVQNAMVERWIRTFTGPLRKNFARWLKRASHYGPLVEEILSDYHVPPDLIYLAMIESGFNLKATSHASAVGAWQFIRSTGRLYGLNSGGLVDDRRDVVKATKAAAAHLRDLYKEFGDWYLAFSAYNAGAGGVKRAIRRGGTKNFWTLANPRRRFLPRETSEYVPKILAALIVAKNHKKYGFPSSLFEGPVQFKYEDIKGAADLNAIAKAADVSVDEVEYLNPDLVFGVTPPDRTHSIKLPVDSDKSFKKNLAKIPDNQRVQYVFHRVGSRETVASVAKRYRVSPNSVAKANRLSVRNRLGFGSMILVPKNRHNLNALEDPKKSDSYRDFGAALADRNDNTPLTQSNSSSYVSGWEDNAVDYTTTVASQKYKVRRGDTLSLVARKHGVSVTQLKQWNRIGRYLKAGQVLTISQAKTVQVAHNSDQLHQSGTYRVRRGDTASTIANKHRITLAELRRLNGLRGNLIKTGQILIIKPVQKAEVAMNNSSPSFASNTVVSDKSSTSISSKAQSSYKVKHGDTLWIIAKSLGVRTTDIVDWNQLSGTSIRAGQVLKIFGSNKRVLSQSTDSKGRLIIHAVRRGETLWDLARRYRVTVGQLRHWNALKNNDLIPSQKIKIYAPTSNTPQDVAYNR